MTQHTSRGVTPALALALTLTVPDQAVAQEHQHDPADHVEVGTVAFETTCREDVREDFQRAVAMLHSFWFEQAQATFADVAERDADCALAHWGIAMVLWGNPFTLASPSEDRMREALAHAERAVELAGAQSHREQMYAAAAHALYADYGTVSHNDRVQAHAAAMKALREMHAEDTEALIFYGRAIIATAPPSDLEYTRQREAAAMMEPVFAEQPNHPGLAHYIIHAYDSPALAQHGLAAARRYAEIAPAAPHALHMPSHIFTRVGSWDESIETNRRSAAAEPDSNAAVHPMDYMVYAYLQQGRDAEARRVVERARSNPDRFYGGIIGYNFAAMPARFALERNAWEDAAGLPVPSDALPYVQAVTRFARAIGAARSGNAAMAAEEAAALAELEQALRQQGDAYWSTIVGAQRLAAESWVERARGDDAAALRLARQAAELEETVEKHPVTPGPLLPARELEADLLMELERYDEALAVYEKTLEREPRRARALFGAARAAERAGEQAQASKSYTELLDVMQQADATRAEPRAARAFLARAGR